MARKLNRVKLFDGTCCFHCGMPFEKPYERMPELERDFEPVLRCQHCGRYTEISKWDAQGPVVDRPWLLD